MDRVYRSQRHIYDFTRKYYLIGRDDLINALRPTADQTILEVGCGTGRNMILAADRYSFASIFGFDISSEMLRSAEQAIASSNLRTRISIAKGNAESFDARAVFCRRGFDRIFFSYTLSMIPDWQAAIGNAVRQLSPSGELHIVDFGMMEGWPVPLKRAFSAWLIAFHVSPRPALVEHLKKVAFREGMQISRERLLGGYAEHIIIRPGKSSFV